MATARQLLARGLGLHPDADAAVVARSVEQKDPDRASSWRRFVTKNFADVGAELRVQARQVRPPSTVTAAPQASADAEHAVFMKQWFPHVTAAAAGRYGLPGGALGDATPLSDTPSATPATNPPTGWVHRPPQKPNSHPPPAYTGPAVPVATPSTTVTPLTAPPAPQTPEEAHARRIGGRVKPPAAPIDLTVRQPPGRVGFTR